MSVVPGTPSWSVLTTPDPATSIAFYTGLFGWTITDTGADFGHHHTVELDGAPVGGLVPVPEGERSLWGLFLHADDATATRDAAIELGATANGEVLDLGPLGLMASITDPSGGAVSFWQPRNYAGAANHTQPGFPVFYDLHTRDADAARKFYTQLFGFESTLVDELAEQGLKYWTVGPPGGEPVFGLMDVEAFYPASEPALWNTSYGVDDTDKAYAWALGHGASPMIEPSTNQFGRYACVADPTGAHLYLMAPA